jgi:hypothetical protein
LGEKRTWPANRWTARSNAGSHAIAPDHSRELELLARGQRPGEEGRDTISGRPARRCTEIRLYLFSRAARLGHSMSAFDERYWNLTQAAAWVVYRSTELVEQFVRPSRDSWAGLKLYPIHPAPEVVTSLSELHDSLVNGELDAWGRTNDENEQLQQIPAIEWADLDLSPPGAYRRHRLAGRIEPWLDIRLERQALLDRWPDPSKPFRRQKSAGLNWKAVDRKIGMVRNINEIDLSISDRSLATRLIKMLEWEYSKDEIPSERALRGHISDLRKRKILPPRA